MGTRDEVENAMSEYLQGQEVNFMKEPTLFKVELLEGTAYNDEGDILRVKAVDEDGTIYYYDSFHRWCYLKKSEEGTVWKRRNKKNFKTEVL